MTNPTNSLILDIAQDPRWGRAVECYGEDPYLVGQLGKQMIQSLQKHKLVATPKHFAVYSIPVGGRDGGTRTDRTWLRVKCVLSTLSPSALHFRKQEHWEL